MIHSAHTASQQFTQERAARIETAFGAVMPLPVKTAASLVALAPPEPVLLGPIAPGTITLIRGPRGAGKSWLALAAAHAIAGGTGLLGWAGRMAPALYIEAAMGGAQMGRRLEALGPVPSNLHLVCDCPLDLGADENDVRILDQLPSAGTGVLVLDGLSLLVPPGRNAGARWRRFCDWLRDLRRDGFAVVLVDHARRPAVEDLADTVIALKPMAGDEADLAVAAEITSRHALARADRAFAAHLDLKSGTAQWTRTAIIDPALQAVADEAAAGSTVRDIAQALGLSTATAWRRLERAKALGLISGKPRETSETGETSAAARKPPETNETARAPGKPRETSETRPALARVSTEVLQRTLKKRLKAQRKGRVNGHRPGHPGPDQRRGVARRMRRPGAARARRAPDGALRPAPRRVRA